MKIDDASAASSDKGRQESCAREDGRGGEGRPRGKGPKSIKTLIERAEKTTAPVRLRR